jgi:hypothetical protein
MKKCDLLVEKGDLLALGHLRERHDPDPIWVEPVTVPLATLDNGVERRRRISRILRQLCNLITTAQNTPPKALVGVAIGFAYEV